IIRALSSCVTHSLHIESLAWRKGRERDGVCSGAQGQWHCSRLLQALGSELRSGRRCLSCLSIPTVVLSERSLDISIYLPGMPPRLSSQIYLARHTMRKRLHCLRPWASRTIIFYTWVLLRCCRSGSASIY